MATEKLVLKRVPSGTALISNARQAYSQMKIDEDFERIKPEPKTIKQRFKSLCHKSSCACNPRKVLSAIKSKIPLIDTLRTYQLRRWIAGDIIAGISVGVMHIPQGLGFAILTGVPPVNGLYSSFWPVIIYALFGTGHHVSIGTMALISLMINTVVEREVANFSPSAIKLTGDAAINSTSNHSILHTVLLNDSGKSPYGYSMLTHESFNISNITASDPSPGLPVPLYTEEDKLRSDIACSVTLIIGLMQCAMGVLRLGMVSIFMPSPFVGGFTTGATFHVVTSQIKFLLGIKVPGHDGILRLPLTWISICKSIPTANATTVIFGLVCIVLLFVIKTQINDRFKKKMVAPIPAELLIVIAACIVSYLADIGPKYGVKTVKYVPSGMPPPYIPSMRNGQTYIVDSFIIAVVSFSLTYSMGSLMGTRHQYSVAPNQEMAALGISHIVTACFSGFAGAAAPPRCLVMDGTGGKTQVAGIVSSLFLLLVLFVAGPLFAPLPNTVLSAIIIVAILPLLKQFSTLPQHWKINRYDFFIWILTFLAVTILDIGIGLVIGVVCAMGTLVVVPFLAKAEILGATNSDDLYLPVNDYGNVEENIPIRIIQFQGDLNFVSKERFKSQINSLVKKGDSKEVKRSTEIEVDHKASEPLTKQSDGCEGDQFDNDHHNGTSKRKTSSASEKDSLPKTKGIIIDMSRIAYIDMMGIATLKSVQRNMKIKDIDVVLCCVSMSVLRKLENAGMKWANGKDIDIYPSIADARSLWSV